MTHEL